MQSDNNTLYRLTAARTGKSQIMYKDLGNFVFGETYRSMRKPKSLILKLKGVGTWHLRKKRMEGFVNKFVDKGDATREDFESDTAFLNYTANKPLYDIFVARLKEYTEYITSKKEVREKRYVTQKLLEPVDRSDEVFKSS